MIERLVLQTLRRLAQTEEFQWQLDHALQLDRYVSSVAFGNSLEAHRSIMPSIMRFVDSLASYPNTISGETGFGNDVATLAAAFRRWHKPHRKRFHHGLQLVLRNSFKSEY